MSKTLLVVDDAAIVRAKIKEVAEEIGWTVVGEAQNGKEAVEIFAQKRPFIVTLDLVMPECDGLQALREILAMDPEAKVIVISALGQKNILKDAFKLGAADFLIKPFDRRMLINTLQQFVAEGYQSPTRVAVEHAACEN